MPVFEIRCKVTDGDGKVATVGAQVNSVDVTAATTRALAFAQAVADLSSGVVSALDVVVPVSIAALTGNTLDTASDVEEKLAFAWRTANGFVSRLSIPAAINDTVGAVGTDFVPVVGGAVHAAVQALIDELTTAGSYVDTRGDAISSVINAIETFRPRKRK